MGLQPLIVTNEEEGKNVSAFFSWLAWAAGTLRPNSDYTYTSNWPYDPLVGNNPLPDSVIWSIVSASYFRSCNYSFCIYKVCSR